MTYPALSRPEPPPALVGLEVDFAALRRDFGVSGAGLTVAIFDTGLSTKDRDLAGRVRAQVNFTRDNYGKRDDASDGDGHGSAVASMIAGAPLGIAPGAGVVPVKVLANVGEGSFDTIELALGWVLNNHAKHDIAVVCIPLSSTTNETSDEVHRDDGIRTRIGALRQRDVPVVVTSGDAYHHHKLEGLAYPAILRECINVGTLTSAGRLSPFSQRLSQAEGPQRHSDVFAEGGVATVTGFVLLLQAYFLRHSGRLPPIALVEWCLRASATPIRDVGHGGGGAHTEREFLALDASAALLALHGRMRGIALANGEPDLRPPTLPPAHDQRRPS
jgi:hypothetical protein